MTIAQSQNLKRARPDIKEITVPVDTDVFARHPEAVFYVGVVATPEGVHNKKLYKAAARLRFNVYVREKGLMHPNLGTVWRKREHDKEDGRSIHFAVVKNNGPDQDPSVVGGTRLITKRSQHDLLPVERLFPEAFALGAAAINSVEASRFIARSENRREQHTVARALIRALAVRAAVDHEQPVYAVADRLLLGMFNSDQVGYTQLAEPRVLDEYLTASYRLPNSPVSLDAHQVLATMTSGAVSQEVQSMYQGFFTNQGVGYFDAEMKPISAPAIR